ncbi:MAG: hypothetical protein LBJ11_01065 [Oscillospiraceae bacterium]|jgi:hypothetical protein|nr:hypothetical protein [Oscillospiraceae bacterium]
MADGKKIMLPKQLQIEMMKFFLKTSIPHKKMQLQGRQKQAQQNNPLSKL